MGLIPEKGFLGADAGSQPFFSSIIRSESPGKTSMTSDLLQRYGVKMSKQLVGKEVTIVYLDDEGQEQEYWALKVLEIETGLITVREPNGKIRVMNMTSPVFVQVYE